MRRVLAGALLVVVLTACDDAGGDSSAGGGGPPPSAQPPGRPDLEVPRVAGGVPQRGHAYVRHYGCGFCHVIPGVDDASGNVGPSLAGFARRRYIAGALSNTPNDLVLWLIDPKAVKPGTAMPALGMSELHARDIAAYLYTLGAESPVRPPALLPPEWLYRAKGGK